MQLTTCTGYQAAGMSKLHSVMCVACSPYFQSFLYLRTFGRSGMERPPGSWYYMLSAAVLVLQIQAAKHAVACTTQMPGVCW
jgi:hypothetical protein